MEPINKQTLSQKMKAYLAYGAKPLPGETVYPNPKLGYGTLCLDASFP